MTEDVDVEDVDVEGVDVEGVDVEDAGFDDVPEDLERPEPPVTGDPAVDDATSRLADAATGTLEEQLPVLESVHRTLQDRLADVEG